LSDYNSEGQEWIIQGACLTITTLLESKRPLR